MVAQPRIYVKALQLVTLFATFCSPLQAQLQIGENTSIVFATIEESKKILTHRDEFVQRMSPFDRSARLKTDRTVSEKKYLAFVSENVLAWTDSEKKNISSAFQGIQKKLEALSLPFPKTVYMIKTTGNEEGNAPYTRANAIVFPASHLKSPTAKIQHTICHELFHVLSRQNPELREKLYAVIGFEKCDEIAFPPKLKLQKLTNPDAPRNDHRIHLQVKGKGHWAVPIIFSKSKKYDVKRGGEFFSYLQFKFLLVERDDRSTGESSAKPRRDGRKGRGKKPTLVDMQQVSGFFEQVGNNTGYIIHPEEILADNFALLVLGKRNTPSPEIIEKLNILLK